MSDEMAVSDNASKEEHKVDGGETETEAMETADASEPPAEASAPESEATSEPIKEEPDPEPKEDSEPNIQEVDQPVKEEPAIKTEDIAEEQNDQEVTRGIKRRASAAFSDPGDEEFKGFDSCEPSSLADYSRIVEEERNVKRRTSTCSDDGFKGFDLTEHSSLTGYCQVLERLEAEVSAAVSSYTPIRSVMASPAVRASKRARQDTDSSRPSSALSSRSDGDGAVLTDASMSPAGRGGRRATTEMSSPALRVPLERGWRRELVYRAVGASDTAGRRNADIYYYTPLGKKLRSTREVAEHLSGTGLTLENFSFFKEPLGIDDPEKEIIRDAKVIRRVESPVPAAPPPVVDGKRTPKPKPPKGASPEPVTPKSPPAKLKVKSMGSRLSSNGTTPKQAKKAPAQAPQMPAPADNNNSAAWKKPRGPPPLQPRPANPQLPQTPHLPQAPQLAHLPQAPHVQGPHSAHVPQTPQAPQIPQVAQIPQTPQVPHVSQVQHVPHNPPPVVEREPVVAHHHQMSRQSTPAPAALQPCSMSCGRGAVPSLACAACLCLYHPACVGVTHTPDRFLCKNCRNTSSPPLEPPPLTHKSGVTQMSAPVPNMVNTGARRLPVPAKVPKNDKRVMLRMKVAGGPDGSRVWAVAKGGPARPALPQSLAVLNGRRFIVVARASQ